MMRKSILAALMIVPSLGADQDTIRWINDLKQGMFESKQTGKPLFVVFR